MTFVTISQSNDINDDLIYPVDTKEQIAVAIAEMVARNIDQLPVFSTSLTMDELATIPGDSFPVVNVLTAKVVR